MSSLQRIWFPVVIDFAELALPIPVQIGERRGRVSGARNPAPARRKVGGYHDG